MADPTPKKTPERQAGDDKQLEDLQPASDELEDIKAGARYMGRYGAKSGQPFTPH